MDNKKTNPADPVQFNEQFYDAHRVYFEKGLGVWKDFVLNDLGATSIADFGCGQGDWMEPFVGTIPVWACDGYADENHLRIPTQNFRKVDIGTIDPKLLDVGPRDVVVSLEVMEHMSHDQESNFLDCMLSPKPRLAVFGVASGWGTYDATKVHHYSRQKEMVPGGKDWHPQFGRHHVNCQPVEVVIEKMKRRGYVVDDALTQKFSTARTINSHGRSVFAYAGFYRKNTRVYRAA